MVLILLYREQYLMCHLDIPVIITNLMVFAVNILMETLLLQLLYFHPNF